MNKQYKIGDEVLVRGIVNSEVRNGGIHVLHDGVDAFYLLDQIHEPQKVVVPEFIDSYIRYAKAEGMSLFIAMDNAQNKESEWIIANEKPLLVHGLTVMELRKRNCTQLRYLIQIPFITTDSLVEMIMVYVLMQATTQNGNRGKETNSPNLKSKRTSSGRGSLRKRWRRINEYKFQAM
ncbi:hypothetical protein [Streptococcus suis]